MSLDIRDILDDWPYKPDEINVRRIRGRDGREKIQLRLDLGLLQMEAAGRPDGQKPHGAESLLDHYERRAEEAQQTGEEFSLPPEACQQLRLEGILYYHRYVATFVLGDYESVIADTERNLRLFDFCAQWAEKIDDRLPLEPFRPYVIMMNTRARARLEKRKNHPQAALKVLQGGIKRIESFYRDIEQSQAAETSAELAILKTLRDEFQSEIPPDPNELLRADLQQAIDDERYEDAAILRDKLGLHPPNPTGQ